MWVVIVMSAEPDAEVHGVFGPFDDREMADRDALRRNRPAADRFAWVESVIQTEPAP